ncbi:MAG: exodeoxyribonuclease VII large subunit [Alphaproteobacteria bacterium]|nr:exodeoxyribonuclease VII large subunit [Alphaproteobacteria bacterium]MCB9698505.1 exodeoxyribonuclease VII large subunit [Alphaproteobacteria bacterium]
MQRLTVAGLALQIDRLLNRSFPAVAVEGELAQVQVPSSGHAYLLLREGQSTLQCVVWRNDWAQRRHDPKVGDRVVCHGRVGAYAQQGRWQLYANRVEPVGQGELERRRQQVLARLEADGLLDPRRRRPLPKYPRVVGVATSPKGAALQDFLRVSRERWPAARILVAPCTVQGEEAASSVIRALELLYDDGRAEVVVVTRGGGSKLDLLPFDDEQLARWIATGPMPVVSAVGHEIDTTIADRVADAVAATPSAAAAKVFPEGPALAQRVDEAELALDAAWARVMDLRRRRVEELRSRLRHPARVLRERATRRAELRERLDRAATGQLSRRRTRLEALQQRLEALSPFRVLERGYAVVEAPSGVVRDPAEVHAGDAVTVRVARGTFTATVD